MIVSNKERGGRTSRVRPKKRISMKAQYSKLSGFPVPTSVNDFMRTRQERYTAYALSGQYDVGTHIQPVSSLSTTQSSGFWPVDRRTAGSIGLFQLFAPGCWILKDPARRSCHRPSDEADTAAPVSRKPRNKRQLLSATRNPRCEELGAPGVCLHVAVRLGPLFWLGVRQHFGFDRRMKMLVRHADHLKFSTVRVLRYVQLRVEAACWVFKALDSKFEALRRVCAIAFSRTAQSFIISTKALPPLVIVKFQ